MQNRDTLVVQFHHPKALLKPKRAVNFHVCNYILLPCEITTAKTQSKGEKRSKILPWISLSKLQLQCVVDLIMSVRISDVQNVFTCQQGEEMIQSIRKAELSSCDANPSEITDILRWQ